MRVSRWVQLGVAALAMASCAEAKDKARPSLLPEVAKMGPAFACIEAAPRNEKGALTNCFDQAGIAADKLAHEPISLSDFKQQVVVGWLMLARDPKRPLTPSFLPKAIDYAKCVEGAAYTDAAFSSRTSKGVAAATSRSELACKDHPLSLLKLDPKSADTPPDASERLFASLLARSTLTYALKQNGWFPDDMRPCIRYLDGRPPSAGCKGKLEGKPPVALPPQ